MMFVMIMLVSLLFVVILLNSELSIEEESCYEGKLIEVMLFGIVS